MIPSTRRLKIRKDNMGKQHYSKLNSEQVFMSHDLVRPHRADSTGAPRRSRAGLHAAFARYMLDSGVVGDFGINFMSAGAGLSGIGPDIEDRVMRAFDEIMTDIRCNSSAGNVFVEVENMDGEISLTVNVGDDGYNVRIP